MATSLKNLSGQSLKGDVDLSGKKFAIVVSEWNDEITESLYDAAYSTLLDHGAAREKIIRKNVPGSFELSLGAQWMAREKNN